MYTNVCLFSGCCRICEQLILKNHRIPSLILHDVGSPITDISATQRLVVACVKRYTDRTNSCMYEVESKSNLNISIKRQWLELERCLFLSFYQGSIAELNALVAALIHLPKWV